jgi:hypothetical protein
MLEYLSGQTAVDPWLWGAFISSVVVILVADL